MKKNSCKSLEKSFRHSTSCYFAFLDAILGILHFLNDVVALIDRFLCSEFCSVALIEQPCHEGFFIISVALPVVVCEFFVCFNLSHFWINKLQVISDAKFIAQMCVRILRNSRSLISQVHLEHIQTKYMG